MNFPSRKIVESIRKEYPTGTRVELISMDDPYRDMPVGLRGTVKNVDDTGTIFVSWDNNSCLGVVYGEDFCRKLHPVKIICNGDEEIWDCRDEAIEFYMRAMAGSDGSERNRYSKILEDLAMGNEVCTDEE